MKTMQRERIGTNHTLSLMLILGSIHFAVSLVAVFSTDRVMLRIAFLSSIALDTVGLWLFRGLFRFSIPVRY